MSMSAGLSRAGGTSSRPAGQVLGALMQYRRPQKHGAPGLRHPRGALAHTALFNDSAMAVSLSRRGLPGTGLPPRLKTVFCVRNAYRVSTRRALPDKISRLPSLPL